MKVMVFGIDGMSPDVLKKVIDYLELPHLRKIIKDGIVASTETVFPPSSAPAWTSLFTGTTPEAHGVFDFFDTFLLRKGIFSIDRTLSSVNLWNKTVWAKASLLKKRVLCVGVPVFYPAHKVNGIYIAGELLTPQIDRKAVYPVDVYKLVKDFGYEKSFNEMHDAIARISTTKLYGTRYEIFSLIEDITNNEKIKFDIFRTLFEQNEYDLSIFVTTAYDYISHYFLDESNIGQTAKVMKPYFNALDNFAKYIISNLDDDSILFVVSDHGMHTIYRVFLINNWLRMKKLLIPREYHIKNLNITHFQKKALHILVKFSRYLHLDNVLRKYVESKIKNMGRAKSFVDAIDIENSLGYCLSYSSYGIFLKQKKIKQRLMTELKSLKDDNYNNKIFNNVWSYTSSEKAPDIILMPNKGYTISPLLLKGENILVDSNKISVKVADHTVDATFIAYPRDQYSGYLPKNITDIHDIILENLQK
ncbi:hypothetical protein E3E31_00260 [Thermococcus sp. M39]|uniref:alkaline phosphatase family protein n=1 Tax=Thermococcus sp. M39 TaxID=1638262 RepID=UPI00143A4D2A|nr:alkaline phosphatase family protein [Thermococcus sp. M39]NJE06990.1 hypothetical protein [Thermococcus sp. M39]